MLYDDDVVYCLWFVAGLLVLVNVVLYGVKYL